MAFKPIDALLGGALIGTGSGAFMMLSKRIAGNSGVLKSLVIGPRDTKVAYLAGLVVAGILLRITAPTLFETPSDEPTTANTLWGIVIGIGTTLGNGCTSGHGLCGLSRFSRRSLVAVPIFMVSAIVTATISAFIRGQSCHVDVPAPATMIEPRIVYVTLATIGVLMLALVPTLWHWSIVKKAQKESPLVAAWCGLCAGAGLAIGGMVRPSVIQAALTPFRFDFTLWVLFTAAIVTTFTLYRIASRAFGVAEACTAPGNQGSITTKLIVGAVLFGIGWGATGLCPGPLIVLVAAQPTNINGLLCLLGVVLGMLIAESKEMSDLFMAFEREKACSISCKQPIAAAPDPISPLALRQSLALPPRPASPPPSPPSPLTPSTPEDLKAALDAGALIVELRAATPSEGIDGTFRTINGAVSVLWDSKTETMNLGALPKDKTAPLILVCRTGNRAGKAAAFLITSGYTRVFNGGGPMGPIGSWGVLITHCGELAYSFRGGLRQLFDGAAPLGGGSSTYTYILTDDATKEAIIIDPVLEQARAWRFARSPHGHLAASPHLPRSGVAAA